MKINRLKLYCVYVLGIFAGVSTSIAADHYVRRTIIPYDTSSLAPDVAKQWEDIWYNAVDVSLVRLIANPHEFHQTPVRVIGILTNTEFGILLFLDRESRNHFIAENAITIVTHESYLDFEALPEAEGKYVQVVGEFHDEHTGSFDVNGSLYHVLPILPGQILRKFIGENP